MVSAARFHRGPHGGWQRPGTAPTGSACDLRDTQCGRAAATLSCSSPAARRRRPPLPAAHACAAPGPCPAELKQLLYALFGQYGKIIDVVTMRTDRLRGQVRWRLGCGERSCFAQRAWERATFAARRSGGMSVAVHCCAGLQQGCLGQAMRADADRALPCSLSQAWVAFADIAAATSALRGMQGFPFYEKPVVRGVVLAVCMC